MYVITRHLSNTSMMDIILGIYLNYESAKKAVEDWFDATIVEMNATIEITYVPTLNAIRGSRFISQARKNSSSASVEWEHSNFQTDERLRRLDDIEEEFIVKLLDGDPVALDLLNDVMARGR